MGITGNDPWGVFFFFLNQTNSIFIYLLISLKMRQHCAFLEGPKQDLTVLFQCRHWLWLNLQKSTSHYVQVKAVVLFYKGHFVIFVFLKYFVLLFLTVLYKAELSVS